MSAEIEIVMKPSGAADEKGEEPNDKTSQVDAHGQSLRHDMFDTLEPAPDTVLYRDYAEVRPSVSSLISGRGIQADTVADLNRHLDIEKGNKKALFGMLEGVFCRCLLNIFGVLMFLRLGWIVGNAGMGLSLVIILLCLLVTSITTASLSAICTNGEVRSGGAYFMISRSLGPNFGGAIGILFSLANAGAVALHLVGFAEQVEAVTGWSIRIVASVTLVFLIALALVGVGWVIKFQLSLLVLLTLSIGSYIIGTFLEPDPSKGYTGYTSTTFASNWGPDYDPGVDFVLLFSVFFPASTGIMAGANISGDLANPQKAIPTGTFAAVFVSALTYIMLVFLLGATLLRRVPGLPDEGLIANYQIMVEVSLVGGLIIAGIFAAGLSSALAALVGAPRVLQAVAADDLFPIIKPLEKGRGANNEPVRAYVLTFIIAFGFIMIGDLNGIAPLITNFFLISYALINYACFAASETTTPGWRPSFKYYNKWAALIGVVACVILMFVIEPTFSAITFLCTLLLYKYVQRHPPDVNWGSVRAGLLYRRCARSAVDLERTKSHVKTYRPSFMLLSMDPASCLDLARFIGVMARTDNGGVVHIGQVIVSEMGIRKSSADLRVSNSVGDESLLMPPEASASPGSHQKQVSLDAVFSGVGSNDDDDLDNADALAEMEDSSVRKYNEARDSKLLVESGIEGFIDPVIAPNECAGYRLLMETSGLGRLRPNTIVAQFPDDWRIQSDEKISDWLNVLRHAFALRQGVVVTRGTPPFVPSKPDARIDVYWLSDDGGLTLLLPWLLQQSPKWSRSRLRVLSGGRSDLKGVKLLRLLERFRIVADAQIVDTAVAKDGRPSELWEAMQLDRTRYALCDRSKKCTRLHDIIKETSEDAELVVISLPVPSVSVPARKFMAWIDLCSGGALGIPVILVRGTQQVITYYS